MIDAEFFISDPVVEHVPDDEEQYVTLPATGSVRLTEADLPGYGKQSTMHQQSSREHDADPQKRDQETLDRELDELTSELRMVIPGVTVLLAFLLSLPFTSVFSELSSLQSDVYFVAFLSTAVAVVFLLGEGAYHQIRGKPYSKACLLKTAIRQMVIALVLLGISLSAVVFLVTDLLFGTTASALLSGGIAILIVGLWFALPLSRRMRNDR